MSNLDFDFFLVLGQLLLSTAFDHNFSLDDEPLPTRLVPPLPTHTQSAQTINDKMTDSKPCPFLTRLPLEIRLRIYYFVHPTSEQVIYVTDSGMPTSSTNRPKVMVWAPRQRHLRLVCRQIRAEVPSYSEITVRTNRLLMPKDIFNKVSGGRIHKLDLEVDGYEIGVTGRDAMERVGGEPAAFLARMPNLKHLRFRVRGWRRSGRAFLDGFMIGFMSRLLVVRGDLVVMESGVEDGLQLNYTLVKA